MAASEAVSEEELQELGHGLCQLGCLVTIELEPRCGYAHMKIECFGYFEAEFVDDALCQRFDRGGVTSWVSVRNTEVLAKVKLERFSNN